MRRRWTQFRVSHLLWCMLVVAAFFSGRHWSASPQAPPAPQTTPTPIAIDFAYPTQPPSESEASDEVFSFYIGIAR